MRNEPLLPRSADPDTELCRRIMFAVALAKQDAVATLPANDPRRQALEQATPAHAYPVSAVVPEPPPPLRTVLSDAYSIFKNEPLPDPDKPPPQDRASAVGRAQAAYSFAR